MIINAFNFAWFIYLVLGVGYILIATKLLRHKSEKQKLNFMLYQSIFLCVFWVAYKLVLSQDPEYVSLFEAWNELPLQPCNTVIWLSIIAAIRKNKTIMAYCFYAGVLFALIALFMPPTGFFGVSMFKFRCIGYYGTHWLVVATGILYATLGFIKVDNKTAFRAILLYIGITVAMHFVNLLMRATVYEKASYYYTFGKEGNAIFGKMLQIIPVPLLYLIPIPVVSIPVFLFENWLIKNLGQLIRKCKDRN